MSEHETSNPDASDRENFDDIRSEEYAARSDDSMSVDEIEDEAERRELLDRQVSLEEWVMSRAPVMEDPSPRQLRRARRIIFRIERAWLRGVSDEVNGLLFRDASLVLVSVRRLCHPSCLLTLTRLHCCGISASQRQCSTGTAD